MGTKPIRHTLLEMAWLAGFIDGDGSIQLASKKGREGSLELMLSISQKGRAVLDHIVLLLEKWGCESQTEPYWLGWIWQLQLSGRKAYQVLKLVEPYLVIKRGEAQVAFEFWENWVRLPNRACPKREAEISRREELYYIMKDMKKRGRGQWVDSCKVGCSRIMVEATWETRHGGVGPAKTGLVSSVGSYLRIAGRRGLRLTWLTIQTWLVLFVVGFASVISTQWGVRSAVKSSL